MAYTTTDDVYRITGINTNQVSAADVAQHILEGQAQVDRIFKTTFETNQITETKDGTGTKEIFVRFYPIVSLDAVTIDGTSVTTTDVDIYTDTGKLRLQDDAEVSIWKNTQPLQNVIQYTYGYDYDFTTPANTPDAYFIRKLTSIIVGMMALAEQIGGTFDDVTSYSIPDFTASKGEPFTNIRETLTRLRDELERMMTSPIYKSIAKNVYFA